MGTTLLTSLQPLLSFPHALIFARVCVCVLILYNLIPCIDSSNYHHGHMFLYRQGILSCDSITVTLSTLVLLFGNH